MLRARNFVNINYKLLIPIFNYIDLGCRAVFAAYMSKRGQIFLIFDSLSYLGSVMSGVHHTSIIYTLSLYNYLEYCNYHAHADDTKMYGLFDNDG